MAIKKFSDYESTKSYGGVTMLPRGGYICKIHNATIENYGGQVVKVQFDICEGDFSEYYMKQWRSNTNPGKKWNCNMLINIPADDGSERDAITKRRFKSFIENLEDSNPGYHFDWDEQKFKGLNVGCVFNYRKYWGVDKDKNPVIKEAPNPSYFTSVTRIKQGTFNIPEDREPKEGTGPQQKSADDFMDISNIKADEMPFD